MSASEPGIVSSRGSLGLHNPPQQQPPPPAATAQPVIQTMQLSFGADGNAVYKPVSGNSASPFNVRPAGNGNGVAAIGEGINVNMGMGGGSGSGGGGGGGVGEQSRKKRGRPRKYAPDGSMAVPPLNAVAPPVVSMNNPPSGGFPSPHPVSQPPQNHHQQQLQPQNHHQPNMQNHQQLQHQQHQQQQQPSQNHHQQQQLQNNHYQQQQPPQNHIQQLQIQGVVQGVGAPESPAKKRGRPPGSANKKQHQNHHNRQQQQQQQQQQEEQQFDALGSPGIGFTPHVITVNTGEDVSSKIMSFSQHGPRAICILSANGTISSVTLRQAATSGGSVTYEGRFEILSLSGSFMLSENGGGRSRSGGLSVSLAGPDGRVLGGGVAGLLTAASPVQVVVGSFIADGRKELKTPSPTETLFPPSRLHSVTGPQGPSSPPSNGTLSESSGGPGSPPNLGAAAVNSAPPPNLSNLPWK